MTMKWITRENANVDRIACPWLIKLFIDADAEFIFEPKDDVMNVAKLEDAIPFDVPGAELGHVDGRCSFESIMLKYGLMGNPALVAMAKIVHAADVSSDVDTSPQGAGLKAIAGGFVIIHGLDDHEKIKLETPMYDALYAWCKDQTEKNQ
jgi:hypothetical protein